MTTPIEAAMELWRERRVVEAEQLLMGELQAVMARHGRGSVPWAAALSDLGNLLMNSDQLDRAIQCFRNAADATKGSDDTRKDHLTYRLNLGIALHMAGRLDEAEAELRQGVQERLFFYGGLHPGYAFGLEPLAELLLRRGDAREARSVVDDAVKIFSLTSHERIAPALALRAEVVVAEGSGGVLFPHVDDLADDLVEEVAAAALGRLGDGDPQVSKAVVRGLVAMAEVRLGPDHQVTLNALSALASLGDDVGDHTGRTEAIIGRGHLSPVIDGDLSSTVEDAFRRYALDRLPADLLADLSVRLVDGDFTIDVQLVREPTEEELERLDGVLQSTYEEFRRRLDDRR